MTKFKKHEGKLFRMLDKPVPLTPDAEMPCLVRLIQDDSPMGKRNKDLHGYDPERLTPRICTEVINRGSIRYDGFISCEYYHYELIGTPVAEGSEEWALYKMIQGETVCQKYSRIKRHYGAGYVRCVMPNNKELSQLAADMFLKYFANTMNWQIYKEPKPLLAEAKVGDLCQRRDGKWVQIDRLLSIGGMPWICYEIGGLRYINNGEQLNSKLSELGIISTEPLAPEGTAEWAWQMNKLLGKKVMHPYSNCITDGNITRENKDMFLAVTFDTGWQIYKEPKQPKPKYSVGDWIQYAYPNNPEFDIEKDVLCNAARIVSVNGYEENVNIFIPSSMTYSYVSKKFITKVLSPSEVVIRIGRLSGRVEPVSINGIHIWFHLIDGNDRTIATIRISCLDTPTRELVKSLLKAMRGES